MFLKKWLGILSIILFILVITLFSLMRYLEGSNRFLIKSVQVQTTYQHFSPKFLQILILPYVKKSNLFLIDTHALTEHLMQLPWVHEVKIKRKWPAQLMIRIVEHQPIACWNNNKILTLAGVLIHPLSQTEIPQNLVKIFGEETDAQTILERLNNMQTQLRKAHLKIKILQVNTSGAMEFELNNGIRVKLGKEAFLQRLQRFVKVYDDVLIKDESKIASVDLRYQNGMAVSWK